jgi:hypothetical protein
MRKDESYFFQNFHPSSFLLHPCTWSRWKELNRHRSIIDRVLWPLSYTARLVDPTGLKPAPHGLKGRRSVTRAPGQQHFRSPIFDCRLNSRVRRIDFIKLPIANRQLAIGNDLAVAEGFEPSIAGLTIRCLTNLATPQELAAATRVELAHPRLQDERSVYPIELRRNLVDWEGFKPSQEVCRTSMLSVTSPARISFEFRVPSFEFACFSR